MTETRTVDCRGLACPQPVMNTKAALEGATSPILVIVDNEGSATNVSRFAESRGARVSADRQGDEFRLMIEPGNPAPGVEGKPVVCDPPAAGSTVVYVASEGMGRSDEELGAVLMAAFLDTLSQFKGEVSHAIFLNSGAKLAVEGSPVLDQLRQLEELGVEVQVCGTCLNHFGVVESLAVGTISNMYAIIETLSKAGRVIRP